MKSKTNSDYSHRFSKLVSLLGFSIIGSAAIISIPFISTSCGKKESYAEKEVKKCNYTVIGHVIPSNDLLATSDVYISEGIKGYISGRIYLGNLNASKKICEVVGGQDFIASDIYLPKYVSVDGIVYTISEFLLGVNGVTNIRGKAVVPAGVYEWNFKNCSQLTQAIFIDNERHTIPSSAFYGCSSLTSIDIPKNIRMIGANAFRGCANLVNVNIPSSVQQIFENSFYGCSSLVNINIPDGVTELASSAFYACRNLVNINIPKQIDTIPDTIFSGCTGLTNIVIPNNVVRIQSSAFYGCTGLTNIVIPNSVVTIQNNAFNGCTGLTSISTRTPALSNNLFAHCTALTSLTLSSPSFVTVIPSALGYTSFTSGEREGVHIYVPSNLLQTYIENEAWISCIGSDYIESVFVSI